MPLNNEFFLGGGKSVMTATRALLTAYPESLEAIQSASLTLSNIKK